MKKKKILLLSDDIRMASGIATMAKEIVMGTVDTFDWFNVGAAIKHPEVGKILDLSEDVQQKTGVEDASVKVLPWNGYGNADLIRQLLNSEKPDAILHFTDPRYWTWLYDIEHEIRENVPILYYNIWDDLPDPMYNKNYYASCDALFSISKQTYGINHRVLTESFGDEFKLVGDANGNNGSEKKIFLNYIPHGINSEVYKPVDVPNEFREEILGDGEFDFIFFWSNRNIRRKQPSDVIYAFKLFCDKLGKKGDKVALVMHTNPVDENGTDLPAVVKAIAPDCNIIFSDKKRPVEQLNLLYNMVDCTINIAGNEGFGLTTAESVMAGTPIIVNVTGGLQDQCGFEFDGEFLTQTDYVEFGSLHNCRVWEGKLKWGEWVIPIWSRVQTLAGSVPTPYIWDDKVDVVELSEKMFEMYKIPKSKRTKMGLAGRESFMGEEMKLSSDWMCNSMKDSINEVLENWTPRKRYELLKVV